MNWNLHSYYTNKDTGLIGCLQLSDEEETNLKGLRALVRKRITVVFVEATQVAKELVKEFSTEDTLRVKLLNTKVRYLSEQERNEVARLIFGMDEDVMREFVGLKPRFWTQGSFQYNTLNRPFHSGQEMDIDDGTYLPMTIFESEPKIGHQLLTLLVDSALKSLVVENNSWEFESKRTCARIKIPTERTHIDVPMYAIPKDKFLDKQVALEAAAHNRNMYESVQKSVMDSDDTQYQKLDTENVNLALRDDKPGSAKWMNSDPKIVEDWFNEECRRIGKHTRKVCRFMKAWRDAQWDIGGPTSISLMAATVEVLNRVQHDTQDMGSIMKVVADNLYFEFINGVESPDDTDEKPLFPPQSEHTDRERDIVERLKMLPSILRQAEQSETKALALAILSEAFGSRVSDSSLIKGVHAAPAFREEPSQSRHPSKISSSMISG